MIENEWSGNSSYQPGDHIGVLPVNREELVDGLMSRLALNRPPLPQGILQLRVLNEQKGNYIIGLTLTYNSSNKEHQQLVKLNLIGGGKLWENQERLPACDLKTLLSRYIDIATPASQAVLALLAAHASTEDDKKQLQLLANVLLNLFYTYLQLVANIYLFQDSQKYEHWKHWGYKNLLETLEDFPSVSIDAAVLISQLPLIQPRFYSISSSPLEKLNQVDITAAVVTFNTEGNSNNYLFLIILNSFIKS